MMLNKFSEKEVLNNKCWNKCLGCVDSFYINSALVSVYNKKGTEFIDIEECRKKMYSDIYSGKITIPETVDDNWTSVTLARYVEQDVQSFFNNRSPLGKCEDKIILKNILECFSQSIVKVNFEGLYVCFELAPIKGCEYECKVVTTLRGKLASKLILQGSEINFSGVTVPAKNLQRHEVLVLQVFLNAKIGNSNMQVVFSKCGDYFSKIFVDDGKISCEYNFSDCNINWGSFNINRGV